MNSEQIEALVAVIGLLVSLLTWLWRTSASTTKAHLSLGVVLSDVGGLKSEVQHLRDSHIKQDTLIQMMTGQLSKIEAKVEQVGVIASDIASTKALITEMCDQVVPRAQIGARFKAVESRPPR